MGPEQNTTAAVASPRLTSLPADHSSHRLALARVAPRFGWQVASAADGTTQIVYAVTIIEISYPTSDGEVIVTASGQMRSTDAGLVTVPGSTGTRATSTARRSRCGWRPEASRSRRSASVGSPTPAGTLPRWNHGSNRRRAHHHDPLPEVFSGWTGGPLADRPHPPRHLRQLFQLQAQPISARLSISSKGARRRSVHAQPVSPNQFEPGYESHQHEIGFATQDLTGLLHAGDNVLGVMVADDWFAGRISLLGRGSQCGDVLRASWIIDVTFPSVGAGTHLLTAVTSPLNGPAMVTHREGDSDLPPSREGGQRAAGELPQPVSKVDQ
jgi:alpha-L-rhamnosidase